MAIRNRGIGPRVEGFNGELHRHVSPVEIRLMEERVAAQTHKIGTIIRENQQLAAAHVELRQELAATKQEIQRLTASAAALRSERDAHVRGIRDRSLRLEADARIIGPLKEELNRVLAEIEEMKREHVELLEGKRAIDADLVKSRPALQQFSDLKAEMEFLKRENERGRKAIEREKEMHSNHLKQSDVMEKHLITLTGEEERLRSQLEKVMAAAIRPPPPPPIPYTFPGYANNPVNVYPGYTGNQFFIPNAVPQVNYVPMPYYNVGPAPICPPFFGNNIG